MKLIIQIPCYDEEQALPTALADLPREVAGFDTVEWLVVDDGCTDGTVAAARAAGVDHVVRHARNLGLAAAFLSGLREALHQGADLVVNLDGDNQYRASDIPALLEPIMAGRAEFVIGTRPIAKLQHFSPLKKGLQYLGSWVIRCASGTDIPDAPSGFRAFSRRAAMELNVFSRYSYTLETIIQAGIKGLPIESVPVGVNPPARESRLAGSTFQYVHRSLRSIVRILMVYRPTRFFAALGSVPFVIGILIGVRFLAAYLGGAGAGKVQSLILAGVLLTVGSILFVVALVADLIAANRKLLEKLDARLWQMEDRLGRK